MTIFLLCIYFQAERGIFDFLSYLKLFRELKLNPCKNGSPKKQTLFILIPVLCEQLIIEDTILNLFKIKNSDFEIKIAIITSIKEKISTDKKFPTTEEIILKSMESGPLTKNKDRIYIFQDPTLVGNIATQLNFGIKKIKAFVQPNTFYIVYNADSIISENTFKKLSKLIQQYHGKEFAFQQPCAFIRDMSPTTNQFTNALSLYQSWYCLGHESRLIRNYEAEIKKHHDKNNNTKLGVIIGHGSGMTLNINTSNGGYPSDLLTEDLTFGFILSTNNVPILSLPALELADVPNNFATFIKQRSIWFWNIIGYTSCYNKMREQRHPRSQLILLLLEGMGAGAYWFFDAFFIIIPFLISIAMKSYLIALFSFISIVVFYIVPQYFLLKKMPEILQDQGFPDFAQKIKNVSFSKLLPSLFLIILTNSVGPWITTIKSINYLFTKKLPIKYKTCD